MDSSVIETCESAYMDCADRIGMARLAKFAFSRKTAINVGGETLQRIRNIDAVSELRLEPA